MQSRMNAFRISIIVLTIFAALAEGKGLPTTTITISPTLKIEAELAYNDETRMKGLMFRESLSDDAGMLFIFPYVDHHSFWMKNTLIPLDLIWLNQRKEVVYYLTAEPCKGDPCTSYAPMAAGKYVLEVNAGFVKKHNIKIGAKMEFQIPPDIDRIANR